MPGITKRDADSAKTKLVAGLGELLWDNLPQGRQLGGAPANFAVMSARLGNQSAVVSRIGADQPGRDALATLSSFPIDLDHVQVDEQHPTGTVSVTLTDGQPGYIIHEPVAWDFLDFTADLEQLASRTDAVCFGTLAQRGEVSRGTIRSFLSATRADCVRVFDVNLREPFYSPEVVKNSIGFTSILKMNDGEVAPVMRLLGLGIAEGDTLSTDYLRVAANRLLAEFPLKLVCITRGGQGSILMTRQGFDIHRGVPARVVDTIGAGDAFTAALTHYYLAGAPLAVLNEAGNRWGSWMAAQSGAMPPLTDAVAASLRTFPRGLKAPVIRD